MSPLGDESRRLRHLPVVTVLIIVLNALVFLAELAGGDAFVNQWSLVPANIVAGQGWITLLTSMFMHAGWMHILSNMIFFWAFGPELEEMMGSLRFAIFYLVGGLAALVVQIMVDPWSTVPILGASGAIAAVMGTFLVTYRRDRIHTVVLLGYATRVTLVPAVVLMGLWFLSQLLSGIGALADVQTGSVAQLAYIAGFAFGALTARCLESRVGHVGQTLESR
jgi:membrane associated rhomboid family serine protease